MVFKYSVGLLAKFILIFSCFLVSCSHHDDPIPPTPIAQNCLLNKVTGSGVTVTITRNGKGLPVKLDYVYSTSSNNRTTVIEYDAADNIVKLSQDKGYAEYEYDADKKVISGRVVYLKDPSDTAILAKMSYRYNVQGYIDSIVYDQHNFDRYEYDLNGNVVKSYHKHYLDTQVDEYLEYDDKKNPSFSNYFVDFTITAYPPIALTGLAIPFISEHNLKREIAHLASGTDVLVTNTYQYNDLGYPVSVTLVNSPPDYTSSYQYVYGCK